jgi:hypothetical protein
MSQQLVSRSPDLQQLVLDGYDIEVRNNYLLLKHVPYVTETKEVAYGIIASELTTAGDMTTTPGDHVVWFCGGVPHTDNGAKLGKVINQEVERPIADDIVACCSFSSKPEGGYPDYYDKMTAYVHMVVGWAGAIDPSATAKTYPAVPNTEDESIFNYLDSASSRAQISAISKKLALSGIAIIGVGGTGSYILDGVAKTEVKSIHLYDSDRFYSHNAFRSPGAASIDVLNASPLKVDYFRSIYCAMHRGVVAHPYDIDESNVAELREMSFVFIAMDTGPVKKIIIDALVVYGIPFIDCGMGIYEKNGKLGGIVRTTLGTPGHTSHIDDHARISYDEVDDEYDRNIQVAELNQLNAALAVIRWKKLFGFYSDFEHEHFSAFSIDGNHLLNEDPFS